MSNLENISAVIFNPPVATQSPENDSQTTSTLAHLNDPVLWGPTPFPLEHCVDVVGHGHHDWLRVPPHILAHVPLLGVLVDLVVIKAPEGNICAQEHLRALVLNIWKMLV